MVIDACCGFCGRVSGGGYLAQDRRHELRACATTCGLLPSRLLDPCAEPSLSLIFGA